MTKEIFILLLGLFFALPVSEEVAVAGSNVPLEEGAAWLAAVVLFLGTVALAGDTAAPARTMPLDEDAWLGAAVST